MPRYVYDDFRITFGEQAWGQYQIRADHRDRQWTGPSALRMSAGDLEQAVLAVARAGHARHPRRRRGGATAAAAVPEVDAAAIGSQLAAGLFAGDVGEAYAPAAQAVDRRDGTACA